MLAVALERLEVWRMREEPRRMRKSWGRMVSDELEGEGPKVEVTVPLAAPGTARTCLRK